MSTPPPEADSLGLSDAERGLWFVWKRAHEIIRTRIAEEVRAATGLSDADVAILVQIEDAGGSVRQNELVARLGWDRTRLSHQVSRMEKRGLVSRDPRDNRVEVDLTPAGRDVMSAVRPIHAAAVRQHLIEPFTSEQGDHLRGALERISAPRPY